MPRYFVHDLETDKLHIFTGGKADWLTIEEAKRNEIKRGCLWSNRNGCWHSRCTSKNWNFDNLKKILTKLGFEDRGQEGEKLSFAEKIEAQQQRADERAERFEDRAIAAEATSNSLHKQSRDMMSVIPMGQPILVGHHSEKADRNYRERAWNKLGAAVKAGDKAVYYAERAATARCTGSGAVYSDPSYLGKRIKECHTEIKLLERRLEGKFYENSEPQPISDDYRARLEEALAEVYDKLEFHETCLATCGKVVWSKETLKGKKEVLIRRNWEPIVRLNPTTVAVPNICFNTPESQRKWALKYLYCEVQDAR